MSENTLKCSPSADVVCGFPGAECRSVAATVPREWAGRISISDNHLCSINRCFSRGMRVFGGKKIWAPNMCIWCQPQCHLRLRNFEYEGKHFRFTRFLQTASWSKDFWLRMLWFSLRSLIGKIIGVGLVWVRNTIHETKINFKMSTVITIKSQLLGIIIGIIIKAVFFLNFNCYC